MEEGIDGEVVRLCRSEGRAVARSCGRAVGVGSGKGMELLDWQYLCDEHASKPALMPTCPWSLVPCPH